jgi:hypothetical protein
MNPSSFPTNLESGPALPVGPVADASARLAASHERVRAMTVRIFGKVPTISPDFDPEDGTPFIRVSVIACGTEDDVFGRLQQWHRELPAVGEFADEYALDVIYTE